MNTIIAENPTTAPTTLGVGFNTQRGGSQNRDAWKASIGTTKGAGTAGDAARRRVPDGARSDLARSCRSCC